MPADIAIIYTDGSCHTQHCLGAWVAIIFRACEKTILSGKDFNTTHNRMELTAVIKALQYINQCGKTLQSITVITDSQYVTGLQAREQKFTDRHFLTKKGNTVRNEDLVKQLLLLIKSMPVELIKIKAHQQKTADINYNIEADILCRNILRQAVNEL